jgi:hypothetical protein
MISSTRSDFRFEVHRSIDGWFTTLLFIILSPYYDFTAYHWYSPSGGHYISPIKYGSLQH